MKNTTVKNATVKSSTVCIILSVIVGIIELKTIYDFGGTLMPYMAMTLLCTAIICDTIERK